MLKRESSVLENVEDVENLEYSELKSKLELRFGEGLSSQNFYSEFTNRKEKFGESFATLGMKLEGLARAYPECSFAVCDKIACAQFIAALNDIFIKRTLQLEGITSLKLAVERAKTVKTIQMGNERNSEKNYLVKDYYEKNSKFKNKNNRSERDLKKYIYNF